MLNMLKWLPEQASTYAGEIDTVFYIIYWITTFFFLLVTGLLVWFLIKYRYKPGRRAAYFHGNTMLELVWTAVPAAIFIVFFLISSATWAKVKIIMPLGDVQVRLVAKQFAWEFHYPGPDGAFGTADDLQSDGDLHVPVNKTIRLQLTGTDVIHSFFVPVLRLKQDVVPGREIPAWFEATKTGKFEIPCAELCGPGHSGMKGWLYVHSQEDYEKWLQDQS
jgi:cytochrome c oxidase subunit 2